MEMCRTKPLGLVPFTVGALGLSALGASALGGVSVAAEHVAPWVAALLATLALGVGLMRRPHRVTVGPDGVTLTSRLRTRITFARRALVAGVHPGTSLARLALEASLVGGVASLARAASGHDDALKALVVAGALYLRLMLWRRAPAITLTSGEDTAWLDPRDFDDPDVLEAVLFHVPAEPVARRPAGRCLAVAS